MLSCVLFHRRRGFTLLEVVFAMLIAFLVGLSAVAGIIYTRQSADLDKQRLAALNYCRQAMEAAHTNAGINGIATKPLVLFSSPNIEIPATIRVDLHSIKPSGTVDWGVKLSSPPIDSPCLCLVNVSWSPSGSWSRPQSIEMASIIRAGVK